MFSRKENSLNQSANYSQIQLSKLSEKLIETTEFQRLKDSKNSTVAVTDTLKEFSITRYDHSIHSAKQAHLLENANLTDYQKHCLELALLLHDIAHTRASHSVDRIYAQLKDSPKIQEYGYSSQDYHEYHTVKTVASEKFRELFSNDELHQDIIAILSYDDKRSEEEKRKDYQENREVCKKSLSDKEVEILYTLKDWLDRASYIELEFQASNFTKEIKQNCIEELKEFRSSLEIYDDKVVVRQENELIHNSPAMKLMKLRNFLFDETVHHPLNALIDEYLIRNVQADDYKTFHEVVHIAPALAFSKEAYSLLSQKREKSIEHEVYPILTIDSYFLSEAGIIAFSEYRDTQYKNLTREICNKTSSASTAELLINLRLREIDPDSEIYVLQARRQRKDFSFNAISDNNKITHVDKSINTDPYYRVIVATTNNNVIVREELKREVEDEFIKRRWILESSSFYPTLVKIPINFEHIFNKNIFTDKANIVKYE